MKWYLVNLACAFDQLLNALFAGWCDETMSAHIYRLNRSGKFWGWLMVPVDFMFSWQTLEPGSAGHCQSCYLKERRRYQSPPEER